MLSKYFSEPLPNILYPCPLLSTLPSFLTQKLLQQCPLQSPPDASLPSSSFPQSSHSGLANMRIQPRLCSALPPTTRYCPESQQEGPRSRRPQTETQPWCCIWEGTPYRPRSGRIWYRTLHGATQDSKHWPLRRILIRPMWGNASYSMLLKQRATVFITSSECAPARDRDGHCTSAWVK